MTAPRQAPVILGPHEGQWFPVPPMGYPVIRAIRWVGDRHRRPEEMSYHFRRMVIFEHGEPAAILEGFWPSWVWFDEARPVPGVEVRAR